MSGSNKRAKQKLIELYGEECFIEKLHLRKDNIEKYKGKGQYKRMKQLTYHHIIKKEDGGKATLENGALLSAENHMWFNKQSPAEQARLNNIFQQYKMGVLEMCNGKIISTETIKIDFKMEEYDVIPLEVDNREYNRAKVKRETRKALEQYYEREDR